MKSFKEFVAQPKPSYKWFSFTVEEYDVHILFDGGASGMVTEAKHKGLPNYCGDIFCPATQRPHGRWAEAHSCLSGENRGHSEFPTSRCELGRS